MGRLLIFVAVAIGLIAGIHYYLWARLVRDPHLPAPWTGIATVLLVALAASLPAALLWGRTHAGGRAIPIWAAYAWMGIMFLLLVVLLAMDTARLAVGVARRLLSAAAVDQQRRTFVARLVASAAAIAAAGLTAVALRSAAPPIRVRRLRVRLDHLPRAQHGFRIVQLTDLHVGPTIGRAFVEDVVRRTNALAPDLIAITGDLADGHVGDLRDSVTPLADLRARHGVFFVTGNHEYFTDPAGWLAELARLGVRVLQNERVSIGSSDRDSFDLAGVDDRSAVHYGGSTPEDAIRAALAGRDAKRELVLLAHQPRALFDAGPARIGLQLSGHTHGGQIWPFGYLVRLQQPFIAGLHRVGESQIYVSRGTGYWGPPMRLGAPPEITELTLDSNVT